MKFLLLGVLVGSLYLSSVSANSCKLQNAPVPTKWTEMDKNCTYLMQGQVQMEINAAMAYLALGTHFAQDTVNRPGFAEFFFKSASEERGHAIKLMEYLLMRGKLTSDFSNMIELKNGVKPAVTSGLSALDAALRLETQVTDSIRTIMKSCEESKFMNDYHLVDYLTNEFLEEQYKGQRDLAGKISTLGKMNNQHGTLAEFLFDKKLLNGEV